MRKRPSRRRASNALNAALRVAEATATYGIRRELRPSSRPKLFDFGPNGGRNGAAFRDPAFMDYKTLPVRRWVPWIAGFSAGFVDDVLDSFLHGHGTDRRAVVLDPFAGMGTTLVQAVLRGHDAVGFEINPYGALAARTKMRAAAVDLARLDAALEDLRTASRLWRTAEPAAQAAPPPLKTRIPFFSKPVERQALHALAFISRLPDQEIADLFRIAFGAVLVSVSNYTYEPSLGSRPAAGKPLVENADVGAVLTAKLRQIRADTEWL